MPIISSVPALNAIEKGVGATFTLDKAQLALVASVVASAYYSDQSNWKSVILNYKSSTLSQTTSIGFDASLASPTGIFNVATQATDIFEIQTISIVDFQNGYFVIPRSQLTVVDFDVDMTPLPPDAITWADPIGSGVYSTTLNSIEKTGGGGLVSLISNEQIILGDGHIEFEFNMAGSANLYLGLTTVGLRGAAGAYSSTSGANARLSLFTDGSYLQIPGLTNLAGPVPLPNGTIIKIAIDSGDVKFYFDNILQYTVVAPVLTYPYKFEISLSETGTLVSDVKLVD